MSAWPRFRLAVLDPGWDAETGRFDAAQLLWREPLAVGLPQANASAALAAVHDALLRKHPFGGAEQIFLDRYAELTADPKRLRAFWSLPRSVFWTRVAQDLLSACIDGTELSPSTARYGEALAEHVPARALVRHLTAFAAGEWSAPARDAAHEGVVARHGGFALPLDPRALAVPGYRHVEPAVAAGLAYQADHAALVGATLAAIDRYAPELFVEFCRAIRVIALKPLAAGGFDDYSDPELPGAFVASVVRQPLVLADHFIHELQHNRLSFLEECGALFEVPSCTPAAAAGCYSPWRDQPRSLYGLFHGVYVFAAVYLFWRGVYDAGDAGSEARAYALDRVLRLPRQLALAVAVLERHARLTPFGRALLVQLSRDVAAIGEDVRDAALPADAPALVATEDGRFVPERSRDGGRALSVLEALREHVRVHAAGGQCAGLEHLLAPAAR